MNYYPPVQQVAVLIAGYGVKADHAYEVEQDLFGVAGKSGANRFAEYGKSEDILFKLFFAHRRNKFIVSKIAAEDFCAVDKAFLAAKEIAAQETDLVLTQHQTRIRHSETEYLAEPGHQLLGNRFGWVPFMSNLGDISGPRRRMIPPS